MLGLLLIPKLLCTIWLATFFFPLQSDQRGIHLSVVRWGEALLLSETDISADQKQSKTGAIVNIDYILTYYCDFVMGPTIKLTLFFHISLPVNFLPSSPIIWWRVPSKLILLGWCQLGHRMQTWQLRSGLLKLRHLVTIQHHHVRVTILGMRVCILSLLLASSPSSLVDEYEAKQGKDGNRTNRDRHTNEYLCGCGEATAGIGLRRRSWTNVCPCHALSQAGHCLTGKVHRVAGVKVVVKGPRMFLLAQSKVSWTVLVMSGMLNSFSSQRAEQSALYLLLLLVSNAPFNNSSRGQFGLFMGRAAEKEKEMISTRYSRWSVDHRAAPQSLSLVRRIPYGAASCWFLADRSIFTTVTGALTHLHGKVLWEPVFSLRRRYLNISFKHIGIINWDKRLGRPPETQPKYVLGTL